MPKRNSKPPPKPPSKPPSKPLSLPPSPPPYPFTTPTPPLTTFLNTLPPQNIYIIHIDRHPAPHKRKIFIVPLTLNVLLTILLLWRAYVAFPAYVAILSGTLGYDSAANVDVRGASWGTLAVLGVRRAGMFFMDFALYRFVLGWPWDFFYWGGALVSGGGGDGGGRFGPARWRWEVGFKNMEVVVRRSRGWGEEVVGRDVDVMGGGEVGGRIFKERVIPGVERGWVNGRTGYSMVDKNWDLDFRGMVLADRSLGDGTVKVEDFERKVAVHTRENGWLVWEVEMLERGEEGGGQGVGDVSGSRGGF